MTITTDVRINWPVNPTALLDHVTAIAGGDPSTVLRSGPEPDTYSGGVNLRNRAGQGLRTLAWIRWSEGPMCGDDCPEPPALVVLSIDNPYGSAAHGGPIGREVQAHEILPAVAAWLDARGVPRDAWWWNDESWGTYHPGTVDVAELAVDRRDPATGRRVDPGTYRDTWKPPPSSGQQRPGGRAS